VDMAFMVLLEWSVTLHRLVEMI